MYDSFWKIIFFTLLFLNKEKICFKVEDAFLLQRYILFCFEDINIVKLFLNVTQKQTFLQFLFTLTTSHHSGYPLSLIHILAIAAHHHSIRARLVMLASACSSSLLAPHSLFVFPRRRTFFVRRLLLCSARRSSVARNNNIAHSLT